MNIFRRGGKERDEGKPTIIPIIADSHSGSTIGLIKPGQWQLSEGGFYNTNYTQEIIWKQFVEAADVVRRMKQSMGKTTRLIVPVAGDAVDGNHHQTTQLVSPRVDEQERIHIDAMDWLLKYIDFREGDDLYYIEGTPAHVGQGAQSEENIARDLSAIPYRKGTPEHEYKDGRHTWPRLKIVVNGVALDIAHHPPVGPGTRIHTRGNSLRSYLTTVYYRCLEHELTIPRYWVRAHRHIFVPEIIRKDRATIEGVLLPALQSKSEFVNKIASDELATIGVFVIWIEPDGTTGWECPHIVFDPEEYREV